MNREELVEQYFSGEISQEGFLRLKTLLEEDDLFKKEFYLQLEIQKTMAAEKHAPLKERLKKLDERPAIKTEWYRYVAIAAGILFILGLFLYTSPPDYDRLYETNFQAYPNVVAPTVRDNGNAGENEIAKAFNHYDNQHYARAAAAFEKLHRAHGEDYALFYRSMSLMAMGDVQKGISVMEDHTWKEPGDYQAMSHWYLGLAHLKLKHKEKAVAHLETSANSKGPMAQRARKLLQKLD